jgi:hypothetical protein
MPWLPRLRTQLLVLALLCCSSAGVGLEHAQAQATGKVVLDDGSQVYGTILLYAEGQKVVIEVEGQTTVYPMSQVQGVVFDALPAASTWPGAPPAAPPAAAPAPAHVYADHEYLRGHERLMLSLQRERLLTKNRRWQSAAIALGSALAGIGIGAGLLAASNHCVDCKESAFGIPGTMLAVFGALTVVVSTPMLILRVARASRQRKIEHRLERLGGPVALAPLLTARGEALLAARLVF